jgi:hypothetical protein
MLPSAASEWRGRRTAASAAVVGFTGPPREPLGLSNGSSFPQSHRLEAPDLLLGESDCKTCTYAVPAGL